jgi:hypothetical protein
MPASRFLCEHLRQNDVIWACTSRIHAQVPVITTGQLAKTLRQQISCSIHITVVASPALWACPLPLIHVPQCALRLTSRIELHTTAQAVRLVPVHGELR